MTSSTSNHFFPNNTRLQGIPPQTFNQTKEFVGHLLFDVSNPIMAMGLVHGCASKTSLKHFRIARHPSGHVIFLAGFALRLIGNSLLRFPYGKNG